jgi:hypothetical protein
VVVVVVGITSLFPVPKQSDEPSPNISIVAPIGADTVPTCASNMIDVNFEFNSCEGPWKPSHSVQLTKPSVAPLVTLYIFTVGIIYYKEPLI